MQPPTSPARRPLPPLPPRPSAAARPALQAGAHASANGVPAGPIHRTAGRSRPDPSGLRLAMGFGGLAAASALATAFLAPAAAATPATTAPSLVSADAVPVQHVTRYVQLLPGQTPPPNASVAAQAPAPTPRVVVVTTRQSGVKK